MISLEIFLKKLFTKQDSTCEAKILFNLQTSFSILIKSLAFHILMRSWSCTTRILRPESWKEMLNRKGKRERKAKKEKFGVSIVNKSIFFHKFYQLFIIFWRKKEHHIIGNKTIRNKPMGAQTHAFTWRYTPSCHRVCWCWRS